MTNLKTIKIKITNVSKDSWYKLNDVFDVLEYSPTYLGVINADKNDGCFLILKSDCEVLSPVTEISEGKTDEAIYKLAEKLADEAYGDKGVYLYSERQDLSNRLNVILKKELFPTTATERGEGK